MNFKPDSPIFLKSSEIASSVAQENEDFNKQSFWCFWIYFSEWKLTDGNTHWFVRSQGDQPRTVIAQQPTFAKNHNNRSQVRHQLTHYRTDFRNSQWKTYILNWIYSFVLYYEKKTTWASKKSKFGPNNRLVKFQKHALRKLTKDISENISPNFFSVPEIIVRKWSKWK